MNNCLAKYLHFVTKWYKLQYEKSQAANQRAAYGCLVKKSHTSGSSWYLWMRSSSDGIS